MTIFRSSIGFAFGYALMSAAQTFAPNMTDLVVFGFSALVALLVYVNTK